MLPLPKPNGELPQILNEQKTKHRFLLSLNISLHLPVAPSTNFWGRGGAGGAEIGEEGIFFYLFYSDFNFSPLGFFVILRFICKIRDSTLNETFLFCFVLKFQTDTSIGSSGLPLSAMVVNNGFEIS